MNPSVQSLNHSPKTWAKTSFFLPTVLLSHKCLKFECVSPPISSPYFFYKILLCHQFHLLPISIQFPFHIPPNIFDSVKLFHRGYVLTDTFSQDGRSISQKAASVSDFVHEMIKLSNTILDLSLHQLGMNSQPIRALLNLQYLSESQYEFLSKIYHYFTLSMVVLLP